MYRILMLVLCPTAFLLGVLVLLRQPARVQYTIIGAAFAFGWPTVFEWLYRRVPKAPPTRTFRFQAVTHHAIDRKSRKKRSPHPYDILLRPAQGSPETPEEQLLRPADR